MRFYIFSSLTLMVLALSGCPQPPDAKDIDREAKLVGKVMSNGEHCELVNGPRGCSEEPKPANTISMQNLAALTIGVAAIGIAANGDASAGAGLIQAAVPIVDASSTNQPTTNGKCSWNGKDYGHRESVYFNSKAEGDDFWARSGLTDGKTFTQRGAPPLSELNDKSLQQCQCGSGDDGGWGCV
jgi:hypothetical protein